MLRVESQPMVHNEPIQDAQNVKQKEIEQIPGVWYVGELAHPDIKSPNELGNLHTLDLRRKAYEARQQRTIAEDIKYPLTALVEVTCQNTNCPVEGLRFAATDLKVLLPKDEQPDHPVIGPCVCCHQYTTQMIERVPAEK